MEIGEEGIGRGGGGDREGRGVKMGRGGVEIGGKDREGRSDARMSAKHSGEL